MSVIALFSGAYRSAEEIIAQVAERTGYSVASKDVLENAAKKSGLPAEKVSRAMLGTRGFLDGLTREWETSLVHIKAALAETLRIDDRIIHGPAVHLIPPSIGHVLRVEVVASHDYRIKRAMKLDGVDEHEAANLVEKRKLAVARWTQQVTDYLGAPPPPFDVKIPLPATSVEEAADIICESIGKAALVPTEQSLQAVLDFQLASSIGVALIDRKRYSCDVSASSGRVSVVINQKAPPKGKLARTFQSLRFENAEDEVREVCSAIEGVKDVHVRPGAGYHRKSRTLLVDDEKEYVMTLSERFELRDIDSDIAYDGEAALTFVKTDTPDVMVLDLRMPGMHGFDVLKRIKEEHPQVEVIIVTGHGGEKDRERAMENGAFEYFEKPVDINILAEKIREANRKTEKARALRESAPPSSDNTE